MKRKPEKKDELDKEPYKKKKEKGYRVNIYGFRDVVDAQVHLSVLNRNNDRSITGIRFGVIEEKGYHIVFAFSTEVFSEDQLNKKLVGFLANLISKENV
jgi:hypothetical protein